ncbi:hypothetical protein [Sphingobium sp. CFD-2]|uniref:hypothetical protein n=1 Tax=Sphingobium sp. CFD-2 TaxID=2878542 RepID=UPI00214B0270|nr:hypothetical protein [Sphingobium sp. CFD-2]
MTDTGTLVRRLPSGFEELEPFVDKWGALTTAERMTARCESSMEDIREFYDAMITRAEEAITLIEQHPLNELPEDIGTLARLVLALGQVSIAVEVYGQPRQPDAPYPNSIRLVRGAAPYG